MWSKHRPSKLVIAILSLLVTSFLLISIGCGGNEADLSEVESLIKSAEEAGEQVDSYHMVLTMYIESAETGREVRLGEA